MTRSYQMHCTCDYLPSSLSSLAVETKVTIGDRAEFELGKNAHLLAQDKKKSMSMKPDFYLSDMRTILKNMEHIYRYISFTNLQHD